MGDTQIGLIPIAEIKKRKGKRKAKVISDSNDAYSQRYQEILKRNKWREDKAIEEHRQLNKQNASVCENVLRTRMEDPEIAAKAEKDLFDEESVGIKGSYHIYAQLRMRRKQEYFDDEDLYGSDQSDTEEKIQRSTMIQSRRERLQSPILNQGMAFRRAMIVASMSRNSQDLDQKHLEIQKRIKELEMQTNAKQNSGSRLGRSASMTSDNISLPNIDTPRDSRMSGSLSVQSTQSPHPDHREVREACDNLVGVFQREMDKEIDFYRLLVSAYAKNKEEGSRNSSRTSSASARSGTSLGKPPRELEPIGEAPVEENKKEKIKDKDKDKKMEDRVDDAQPSTSKEEKKKKKKKKKDEKDKDSDKKESPKEDDNGDKNMDNNKKKKDKKKKKEAKEKDSDEQIEKSISKDTDEPKEESSKKKKKSKKKNEEKDKA